ncbi:unnamed protein product [Miscanthus lutarioriparius]|uniref:Uncharacterized protein n=1 Tax=Miscanthus lutarioriparius TaxID=422564 RepID=A0A811QB67_9POAL|nr:unnamed protein product [Miscanthus lutarioriparius]
MADGGADRLSSTRSSSHSYLLHHGPVVRLPSELRSAQISILLPPFFFPFQIATLVACLAAGMKLGNGGGGGYGCRQRGRRAARLGVLRVGRARIELPTSRSGLRRTTAGAGDGGPNAGERAVAGARTGRCSAAERGGGDIEPRVSV